MLNLISSDIFRVRKGKSIKGVIGGILCMVLFMAIMFKIMGSLSFMESISVGENILIESEADLQDVKEIQGFIPANGGEFTLTMFTEASNSLSLFLLAFIIAVFGAEFSSGAFRNLLSYESNRAKIYFARLLTIILFSVIAILSMVIISMIAGSIIFGFGGMGSGFFIQLFTGLLLQLPIYIAFISLGQFILIFTKKTSSTIAFYLVGLVIWTLVIDILAMLSSSLNWLMNLELMTALNTVADYPSAASSDIAVSLIFSAALIIASTIFGIFKYQRTDFDFA